MIGDIIEEGIRTLGKNRDAMDETTRVELLLEQVGYSPEIRNQNPHEFSGRQLQRICSALAREFDWDGKGEEIIEDRMFS